jgi:hypothetical protein
VSELQPAEYVVSISARSPGVKSLTISSATLMAKSVGVAEKILESIEVASMLR